MRFPRICAIVQPNVRYRSPSGSLSEMLSWVCKMSTIRVKQYSKGKRFPFPFDLSHKARPLYWAGHKKRRKKERKEEKKRSHSNSRRRCVLNWRGKGEERERDRGREREKERFMISWTFPNVFLQHDVKRFNLNQLTEFKCIIFKPDRFDIWPFLFFFV